MKRVSPESAPRVPVVFDGRELMLPEGMTLAAALLEAGVGVTRHTVKGAPRTAFCMMGACFDCLVRIDGVARQSCQVPVRPGLVVEAGDV